MGGGPHGEVFEARLFEASTSFPVLSLPQTRVQWLGLDDAPLDPAMAKMFFGQVTARFQTRLPVRTIAAHRWPATWWDAVKERFAPRWMLGTVLTEVRRRSIEVARVYAAAIDPDLLVGIDTGRAWVLTIDGRVWRP